MPDDLDEFVRQCARMYSKCYVRIISSDMTEAQKIEKLEKLYAIKEKMEDQIKTKINIKEKEK